MDQVHRGSPWTRGQWNVPTLAGYNAVNYTSATCNEFKLELDELSAKELGLGRISRVLVKSKCIHAFGRVPKKDSGKSRPITDCSRPRGNSLNDYIKPALDLFRMNSLDTETRCVSFVQMLLFCCSWHWICLALGSCLSSSPTAARLSLYVRCTGLL